MKKLLVLVFCLGFLFLTLNLVSASYYVYDDYDDWRKAKYVTWRPRDVRYDIDYDKGNYIKITESLYERGKKKRSVSYYEKVEKKYRGYKDRAYWGHIYKGGVKDYYYKYSPSTRIYKRKDCYHVPPDGRWFYFKCP